MKMTPIAPPSKGAWCLFDLNLTAAVLVPTAISHCRAATRMSKEFANLKQSLLLELHLQCVGWCRCNVKKERTITLRRTRIIFHIVALLPQTIKPIGGFRINIPKSIRKTDLLLLFRCLIAKWIWDTLEVQGTAARPSPASCSDRLRHRGVAGNGDGAIDQRAWKDAASDVSFYMSVCINTHILSLICTCDRKGV